MNLAPALVIGCDAKDVNGIAVCISVNKSFSFSSADLSLLADRGSSYHPLFPGVAGVWSLRLPRQSALPYDLCAGETSAPHNDRMEKDHRRGGVSRLVLPNGSPIRGLTPFPSYPTTSCKKTENFMAGGTIGYVPGYID